MPGEQRGPAVGNSSNKMGGRGEMTKASINLQDLRRRIYVKAKADSAGTDGVGSGCTKRSTVLPGTESAASLIGRITLGEKPTGQPSAGNPHAGLDEAGAGNVAMGAGLRPTTKGVEKPPDPKARAPALDPTLGGWGAAMLPGYPTVAPIQLLRACENCRPATLMTLDPPSG